MRALPPLEAFVLGGVDTGESDRVVTLLTRERGRLGAFVAGARRSKRRFAGVLEPFSRIEARLKEGRSELLFLESASLLQGNAGLRDELTRLSYASHAAELCRLLTREHEGCAPLFDALSDYLALLQLGAARPEALLRFEWSALAASGHAPHVESCCRCGRAPDGGFSSREGGALCRTCARGAPGVLAVPAEALAWIAGLGTAAEAPACEPRLRASVRAALQALLVATVGHAPRTLDVLRQLGIEA